MNIDKKYIEKYELIKTDIRPKFDQNYHDGEYFNYSPNTVSSTYYSYLLETIRGYVNSLEELLDDYENGEDDFLFKDEYYLRSKDNIDSINDFVSFFNRTVGYDIKQVHILLDRVFDNMEYNSVIFTLKRPITHGLLSYLHALSFNMLYDNNYDGGYYNGSYYMKENDDQTLIFCLSCDT